MKHQVSYVVKTESMVLTDFSPMEFHCVASRDKLKTGDKVMVIYLATVGYAGTIGPLDVPMIVKTNKFQSFIDQLIQIMGMDQPVIPPEVPATGVLSPMSETGAAVKTDAPQVEGPTPTPA